MSHTGGFEGTQRREWAKQLGIKMVHIDPHLNHTAAHLGGKWIAPKPRTDAALAQAICHVWITEGLNDKKFVADRTNGFDEWKAYVLGEGDGQAKTPEWQEAETGVPARDVRALAREWGSKKTYLGAGSWGVGVGGACRTATGMQWARMMTILAAMQGGGRPGVNFGNLQFGSPLDFSFYFPLEPKSSGCQLEAAGPAGKCSTQFDLEDESRYLGVMTLKAEWNSPFVLHPSTSDSAQTLTDQARRSLIG